MTESLVPFLSQHWILSSIFVLLFLALCINEFILRRSGFGTHLLSPEQAVQWINHKEAIVVDIRNPKSFSEGHILGSLNIPEDVFDKKIGLLEKFKNRSLIVICASGQTSQKVVRDLKKKGFQALLLSGGLLAWRNAGLPLSKK